MIGSNFKRVIIFICFVTLLICTISIRTFLFEENMLTTVVIGSSEWKQTSERDFNNGTLDKVAITSTGEIKLASETKYIEDDFINESMINYKKNVIIDTNATEIKLMKIVNKTFGGHAWDIGESIHQTKDSGYIIIGETETFGAGGADVWLIKTDAAGRGLWNKRYGGSVDDYGKSVQQTTDGGYIIAGYTESYGAGGFDIWLIKTDGGGKEQWNKTFGGSNNDYGKSVQQTTDDGFIIAGYTGSYSVGPSDVWLIKTDSGGNEKWNKTFGGNVNDFGDTIK